MDHSAADGFEELRLVRRLIQTVLTLSPVLHRDTGHRRNSPHPRGSKLKRHLRSHRIPHLEPKNYSQCRSQLYMLWDWQFSLDSQPSLLLDVPTLTARQ
ncbi:hypothetical protein EYF80_030223 [Liparis tanakae]|uniref:Uncharacterized protein n=1 Tax=Liparis tanakae TaxID=230148 RepID=A0A4Z2H3A8_9TELE|nr:hypothetical protein EYF80_030223 [Liparis tanakae]